MSTTQFNLTSKKLAWIILASMSVYLLIILSLSQATYDYGDGLSHYFISRYSWQHPHLFLDDWGKPVFTLLSSPFAQLGLKGISFFNILCGLFTAYITYRIAEKLEVPFPYLAIVFTCSAPIYLSVMNSGLTEPLFTAIVMLCIWLIMVKRYYKAAIILSFLPMVRAEFSFVMPVFCLYFLVQKKYLPIFLLPVGSILFSIVGSFYYKNILWLIDQNPYSISGPTAYTGPSDIFSYIKQYHDIVGTALAILICIGLLSLLFRFYFQKRAKKDPASPFYREEVILVYGCFLSILVAHSLVWGLHISPTLGLTRYMALLVPCTSIIALRGLQVITKPVSGRALKNSVVIVFAALVLYSPYMLWYPIPFKYNEINEVEIETTNWFKASRYAYNKVYYMDPFITWALDLDPFDLNRRAELNKINQHNPERNMVHDGVLIWDAHFGAEEGNMEVDTLLKDRALKLVKVFKPLQTIKVIGNRDYAVYIFVADSSKN